VPVTRQPTIRMSQHAIWVSWNCSESELRYSGDTLRSRTFQMRPCRCEYSTPALDAWTCQCMQQASLAKRMKLLASADLYAPPARQIVGGSPRLSAVLTSVSFWGAAPRRYRYSGDTPRSAIPYLLLLGTFQNNLVRSRIR